MVTVLPSRSKITPEQFVKEFLNTITPGLVNRSEFIKWQAIELKLSKLSPQLTFYRELAYRVQIGHDFVKELTDSLLASDNPLLLIECAFELLGHTGSNFVSEYFFLGAQIGLETHYCSWF